MERLYRSACPKAIPTPTFGIIPLSGRLVKVYPEGGYFYGKNQAAAQRLVERTRTYDGKRVHFYGRRVAEVNAKIAAYEEERRRLQEAGPLFESVAPEWWELYQQQVKNGTTRATRAATTARCRSSPATT